MNTNNINNALIFPQTAPNAGTLRQLLLFFDTIFHYLPLEPDPDSSPDTEPDAMPDTIPDTGLPLELCTSYAPAPLGDERELFVKIVNGLEKQKENMSGQMSGLALAQLSANAANDRDESSSSVLSAALKKGTDLEKPDLELWQARVLLKLAEALDQEEQEVAEKLTEISSSEKKLLTALKGPLDDEEEWQETAADNAVSGFSSVGDHAMSSEAVLLPRTRAFSRLYCADTSTNRPHILATTEIDAAEPLLNAYETLTKKPATPLFVLPMPSAEELNKKADTWPAFVEFQKKFQELVHKSLEIMTSPAPDQEALSAAVSAWQTAVTNLCCDSPQWELTWYDVSPLSPATLFAKAFPGCTSSSGIAAEQSGALAVLSRK